MNRLPHLQSQLCSMRNVTAELTDGGAFTIFFDLRFDKEIGMFVGDHHIYWHGFPLHTVAIVGNTIFDHEQFIELLHDFEKYLASQMDYPELESRIVHWVGKTEDSIKHHELIEAASKKAGYPTKWQRA